jgi:riboflavin kinase / FMN adenylyltransferase
LTDAALRSASAAEQAVLADDAARAYDARMHTFRVDAWSARLPDEVRGAVWAIGNFDGLHRGHQALFARARELAGARGAPAGVLTFSPHPATVLNPSLAPPLILTEEEREAGIAAFGIDVLCVLRFDGALAALAPDAFATRVLLDVMGASAAVVGEGFRFGHRAAGRVEDLERHLEVSVVPPVKEGDLVCSSSKIRELVLEGKVDAAARLLGRPYRLSGKVIEGDKRGRTIGIPTANLETSRELLPRVGVYATRAILGDGSVVPSVTNIGLRPTFQGQGVRIEAHLLGFDGDLYGERLELDIVARVRDEMRFPGVEALVAQIRADIARAREILGA